MIPALEIQVSEQTHTSEARRAACRLADRLKFDETAQGKLALVVTEVATNLLKHAQGGKVLLSPVHGDGDGWGGMDVFGMDSGPGMANLTECLRDGYSTAGSPGTGMGAIVRSSQEFDVFTAQEWGTVIRARCSAVSSRSGPLYGKPAEVVDVGGVNVPFHGEVESGDGWAYRQTAEGISVLVVDGLGHGPIAAEAAKEAIRVFRSKPELTGTSLVETLHQSLKGTRGAAVAAVEIPMEGELTFTGVGNISGVIWRESSSQHLVSMNGIVGHHMGKARQFRYPVSRDCVIVLYSDGLRSRWKLNDYRGLRTKSAALIAGTLLRDQSRGSDDVTVVVARTGRVRNEL